jgi:hypothetical protein
MIACYQENDNVNLPEADPDSAGALGVARDELVARLDEGARQIERARAEGKNVARWEDFWIGLLRSYERICDRIAMIEVAA